MQVTNFIKINKSVFLLNKNQFVFILKAVLIKRKKIHSQDRLINETFYSFFIYKFITWFFKQAYFFKK